MPDPIDTEALRAKHSRGGLGACVYCGGLIPWPCPTLALLDEINRLRPVVDAAVRVRRAAGGPEMWVEQDAAHDALDAALDVFLSTEGGEPRAKDPDD